MKNRKVLFLAVFIALAMGVSRSGYADHNLMEFFAAVESGDFQVVSKILRSDVDIDARNADGLTPLMIAVEVGHVEIVRELLSKGADVNARIGFYGITALTLASRHGSDSEIFQLLIQAGARKDIHDDRSRIPVIVTELE